MVEQNGGQRQIMNQPAEQRVPRIGPTSVTDPWYLASILAFVPGSDLPGATNDD